MGKSWDQWEGKEEEIVICVEVPPRNAYRDRGNNFITLGGGVDRWEKKGEEWVSGDD